MSEVTLEVKNSVAWITINRPQALNALNGAVLTRLNAVLDDVDRMISRIEVRAVVLKGAGEKAFVAGADIKEMQGLSSDQARSFAEKGQKTFRRLEILGVPVIAAVHGFALGGGCELALACDFIYATPQAKFGLPEVSLGLIPGFGGTQRLARAVGVQMARELTFTGKMIAADEALARGLVNKVVPDAATLWGEVEKTCETILSRGPIAIREAKRVLLEGVPMDIDSGMVLERDAFGELFAYADVTEGLNAFVEKRKPAFQGR
jgi:enoyl-CoA hydratase